MLRFGILMLFVSTFALAEEAAVPDEKLLYKTVGDVKLNLYMFRPEGWQPSDRRSAIVFFFGGGWTGGSPTQLYPQSRFLAAHGMVAFSAEYRIKSKHGTTPFECVADAKSAVRWIRQHAAEIGVDPDRIVAAGASAGGHIALCSAIIDGHETDGEDLNVASVPNAVIGFNPVVDTSKTGLAPERFGEGREEETSPVHHVRKGLPPVLIFHGTADKTVKFENVERFSARMEEAGNPYVLSKFDGMGHGFFNPTSVRPRNTNEEFERTMRESVAFLTQYGFLRY